MARRYRNIKKLPQYFIRTSWDAKDTQHGEYVSLDEAKEVADALGEGWFVFGTEDELVYDPVPEVEDEIIEEELPVCPWELGQYVKLTESAKENITSIYKNARLIVRKINEDGTVGVATTLTTPIVCTINWNEIEAYQEQIVVAENKAPAIGDLVHLNANAKRIDGTPVREKLFKLKLYIINIRSNGNLVLGLEPGGAVYTVVTGDSIGALEPAPLYKAKVKSNVINIHSEPMTNSTILAQEVRNTVIPIYQKKGTWVKTKEGWIYGDFVQRI